MRAVVVFALLLNVVSATGWAADQPAESKSEKPAPKEPVKQSDDGSVLLHAKDATIHGTMLRYEPQPHKNTIGYWTRVEDSVSWEFELARAGDFNVEILQGCGTGSGGAEVDFSVGDQVLKVAVKETGGFQNFVMREIGKLKFDKPGRYKLTVQPKTKPGKAVMDLRSVTLQTKK